MSVIDTTKDLAALFEKQAKATPDAVALEDETRSLTYAELDRETDALALRLRRHHRVGRDVLVGVLMGRSADYVIASLAILRAGGAFLVLELAYPPGLLRDVVDDAKPAVIITQKTYAAQIESDVPVLVIDEVDHRDNDHPYDSDAPPPPLPADDDLERLAFVSYSSGTTGQPKGIANPHRAPVRSYDLRFGVSDLHPGDRVACNVFFVWEMLRPLLCGATVVAVPDLISYDPAGLVSMLASRRITDTLMTPTLLAAVLSCHPELAERLPDLRSLWLNGEVVTSDLCRRAIKALPHTRLLNLYSASETHDVAAGDVRTFVDSDAPVCPVGPPLEPKNVYILDESGNPVAAGESGELWVGGDLLARGYLNLPEQTAKAFHPDPFDKTTQGARMYRTGDMARILPSGLLEITGRVGGMIKTRGYTVQPSAVEQAVVKHLAVSDCAVTSHGDGLERQLVAYVVRHKDEEQNKADLVIDESGYSPAARRALAAHLAPYMIPTLWVEVPRLPTHDVSGKVDLKALPPPPTPKGQLKEGNGSGKRDMSIKTDTIRKLWAASLKMPASAIRDEHSFFDIGGHSLVLANLANRFSKEFGFDVPLAPLAGDPTLQGHLDAVCAARDGHTAAVQADLPAVLRADCILPNDIQPKDTDKGRRQPMRRLDDADTVLLTGATGYLGAFLLKSLIDSTSAHVICLVRFTEPTDESRPAGMARVRKNLVDLSLWDDAMLDRMEILPGNLGRKRLGLSPEAYDDLVSRVDVIMHAAATVNLVYPYAALRSPNVGGTREMLRLASQSGATLHHVSTNGVLTPSATGWPEDAMVEVDDVAEKLLDGYGQTKWVAEQLVLEAGRRGMPVKVYRPGTISGHSVTGSTNTYDLLNALMVESLHLGQAPEVEGWYAEMTPADFVSKAMITLANHVDDDQLVYHLGDPHPVPASRVFDHLEELGYPTGRLPWEEWVSLWNRERGWGKAGGDENEPFTLEILRGGMPTAEGLRSVVVLKDEATKAALERYGVQRPKIDGDLLATYTRHFFARGWLSKGPARGSSNGVVRSRAAHKGRLAGKVAVVTGASSGIGAAVAEGLAKEGAHVALAARRTDALKKMERKLARYGVKVLVHKTDVTSKSEVESLMRETTEKLGAIDILASCAGVMYYTMMVNNHTDEWEQTVDVNCKGLLHCLAATVPGMVQRGRGHVVAISSDAGRKVFPGLGVYSASKFFVEATLQSLRLETAGTGLRVTSIQPGNTATELFGMSTDAEAIKKYGEPSGAKVLESDEVAASVVYAVCQPEHVAVNEVLIEPRDEPI
ncbi:hypothetical protein ACRALDRAFT_1076350 [Sodiomyces alcalophilus JCM 7366]|uniref:uncharacterized protein n=1 Tax=Sodiomyces alcalophilus JCM 7366 TaxID=591952 RepID=UPI0039B5E5AD